MKTEDLLDDWRARHAEPTTGWDFSCFGDSIRSEEPPWSYGDLARSALAGARSALDLGTGGGEVLLGLADALPEDTVATEGWLPNLPVAAAALAGRGIPVAAYDAEADPRLPFDDCRFDVVLARHEAYVATEVARVLNPGGVFLTQQVDGRDLAETIDLFGGTLRYPGVTLAHLRAEAEAAGLVVEYAVDWTGTLTFPDVATLVSYLRMTPWQVPDDFAVDRYHDVLLDLHASGRPLAFTQRRFVLRCVAGTTIHPA